MLGSQRNDCSSQSSTESLVRHDRTSLIQTPSSSKQVDPSDCVNDYSTFPTENVPLDNVYLNPINLSTPRKFAIFGAVWTGAFLCALDSTIVATLTNSISSSFSASNESSWLATSYLLAISVTSPLYGKLSDLIGRKWAHLTALFFFTAGTLMCGLSKTMVQLIIARIIAGCGGGGIMTTASIIGSDLVPLKQRGLVQGILSVLYGIGAGLGGPLGGFLADHGGWRIAFLVQIPLALLGIGLVLTCVRYRMPGQATSKSDLAKRIDYGGSITLIICVTSLLLALSLKTSELYEWSNPRVWGPLMISGIGFLGFIQIENHLAVDPILPMRILMMKSPFCICMINFLASVSGFSLLYMYPLWFEAVKLKRPSESGLHLIPHSISTAVAGMCTGWYLKKSGKYKRALVIWSLVSAISFVFLSGMDLTTGPIAQWLLIVPAGASFAVVVTFAIVGFIASVNRSDIAVVTGLTYLSRYTGQVVGVALSSAILQAVLSTELTRRITGEGASELIDQIRHTSTIVRDLPEVHQKAAIASYVIGLRWVFLFNSLVSLISSVFAHAIEEFPLVDAQ